VRDIAVRVEGLSKRFRIGGGVGVTQRLRRLWSRAPVPVDSEFWALRDVSFELPRGEVLGIVGGNGAGKTTLLKILSRITEPTEGRAWILGRVASLLEVGTGFHPELSGRENIYLNGAILGMRRHEIERRFDEIVEFADVTAFLDTPVKRYSAGMRVRLAFSVAAHLEPEILVVDEVLAVGDAAFQRRCLDRMGDVTRQGRTVLFVSHDMNAVSSLCTRAVLLEGGRIAMAGEPDDVVQRHLALSVESAHVALGDRADRAGTGRLRLTGISISGGHSRGVRSGGPLDLTLDYESRDGESLRDVRIAVVFLTASGSLLFVCDTDFENASFEKLPGAGRIGLRIESLPLATGRYFVNACAIMPADDIVDFVRNAAAFDVAPGDFFGTGRSTQPSKHGSFLVRHAWSAEEPQPCAGS
jgi:lipopolysaccharide transport system ATP-binding protein